MSAHPPADVAPRRSRRLGTAVLNVLRGAVIGAVEVVPGVSGGTLALVVGVYETLITSAGELVRGAVAFPADRPRARQHFARVRWGVLAPLGLGMLTAIVLVSATLAPLIDSHPVQTRAMFAGLIVASLIVPARMVGRWGPVEGAVAVVAALAAFWLTGLTGVERSDPSLWLVMGAASLAVCALVLPGVSGSFLLLVLGMYASTLAAVNDRDVAYLGAFVAGAILGLAVFVTGLQWLLAHHHALTLAAMTGLMLGSLRALWPWQGADASLEAPSGSLGPVLALFALGIVAVVVLLQLERVASRRSETPPDAAVTSDDR
ncbi:MAG: DUF368 domain-containing protein [Demequina sp.]